MTKPKKTAPVTEAPAALTLDPKPKLPRDLFKVPASNRIAKYAEVEAACRESLAQRIDLSYQMYLEIGDEKGWVEEIQRRFEAVGLVVPSRKSLYDNVNIFEVLRMPAPFGLGIKLKQTSTYSYARMRVLAQNREWSLAHPDRARALLEQVDTSEPKIRQMIMEETGKTETPDPTPVLRFKLPEAKVALVKQALDDVAAELVSAGQVPPENRDELLLNIIDEWKDLKRAAQKA